MCILDEPSLKSPSHFLVAWLGKGQVQKFVVVITGLESKEVLERWAFNVITDKAAYVAG